MNRNKAGETPELAQDVSDNAMRKFLGYSLRRVYLVLHQAATGALEKHGLKVRSFSALSLIVANSGVTPSRLADMLQIERSNLVVIIDELETRDLVARTCDTGDRRRYALLTKAVWRRGFPPRSRNC
jgi:hypothetical protein